MATTLRACLLLAVTALKVSQPEAPSTRRFPLDECKRRTAVLQQAALRNDAAALRALLESEDAESEGTGSADGLAESAGGPGPNAEGAESAAWSADGLGANGYTALIVAANNGHLAAAEVLTLTLTRTRTLARTLTLHPSPNPHPKPNPLRCCARTAPPPMREARRRSPPCTRLRARATPPWWTLSARAARRSIP